MSKLHKSYTLTNYNKESKPKLSELMKKIILSIFSMFIFSSFLYADFKTISNEDLQTAISEGIPVIDIRRLDEWRDTGVIPSSHRLTFFDQNGKYDLSKWMNDFEKIVSNKDQKFILVCRSARRTGIVGRTGGGSDGGCGSCCKIV